PATTRRCSTATGWPTGSTATCTGSATWWVTRRDRLGTGSGRGAADLPGTHPHPARAMVRRGRAGGDRPGGNPLLPRVVRVVRRDRGGAAPAGRRDRRLRGGPRADLPLGGGRHARGAAGRCAVRRRGRRLPTGPPATDGGRLRGSRGTV